MEPMGRKPLEPQWLDADEQQAWRQYLHASRLLEAVMDRDLQSHGLQLPRPQVGSDADGRPGVTHGYGAPVQPAGQTRPCDSRLARVSRKSIASRSLR
jgi:hypothetical protein